MENYYFYLEVCDKICGNSKNNGRIFIKNIDFYFDKNSNTYTIFNNLCIKETEKVNNKKVSFYLKENIENLTEKAQEVLHKEISKLLRGSDTWRRKDGENCFVSDDGKTLFVFDANRFGVIGNNLRSPLYFKIALQIYALAMAYNIKTDEFINKMEKAYKRNILKEMCEVRDEIYEFNFLYYFENPISLNSFFYVRIWEYFVKFLRVKEKHNEMKTQISELVNIIEMRKKEEQAKIEAKEKEEQAQKDKEREIKFTRIGIAIALISLLATIFSIIMPLVVK